MDKSEKRALDERFKKYYSTYYASLFKFCLSKLKNDRHAVEDACQETFMVLYKRMTEQEIIDYPYAFMLKTADNIIKRYYKDAEQSSRNVSLEDVIVLPAENRDIDAELSFEQYTRQFSAALSDDDAELFSLRYIEELDLKEIAHITGKSIDYVSTRLYRIRKKLRSQFGGKLSSPH